jgi:hypothetical protein
MCVSLTLKVFGATLFFQGCATMEPISLPQKAAPPAEPPIAREFWAPLVAKADQDPEDGSVTILFRDAQANLVRAAIAACGEGTPRERWAKCSSFASSTVRTSFLVSWVRTRPPTGSAAHRTILWCHTGPSDQFRWRPPRKATHSR